MIRVGWTLLALAAFLVAPALLLGGFNAVSLVGCFAAGIGVVCLVAGAEWVADAETSARLSAVDVELSALERSHRSSPSSSTALVLLPGAPPLSPRASLAQPPAGSLPSLVRFDRSPADD